MLSGIKVVDLSRVMSGPYCTALLADMGAEVIKIETPGSGDDSRHFGPHVNDYSVYFAQLNRNKKSITLNLKQPEACEVLRKLVADADVVVENFRPGVAKRLGVDYESLSAINPRLVYLSISGFGQSGNLREQPAYDLVIQAMSGLMHITGTPDGDPTCVGESIADMWTGLFGSWSILAALLSRERGGPGRYIDLAMFDAMLALQVTAFSRLLADGKAPMRVGNRHPMTTPVDSFPARDGHVVAVVSHDGAFRKFAAMIGKPELNDDPRFCNKTVRSANVDELKAIISAWTRTHTVEEVLSDCREADIPAGPVWDLATAHRQLQEQSTHMLHAMAHPLCGPMQFMQQPARFSDAPNEAQRDPMLGEHTVEVLKGLGMNDADIEQLKQRQAI
ncbi:CaiB/BaiF CoA transferase family protein [Noviherbaspirillum cavernae]|nr:CaiB/BaiF CoA-transferase family protein [Noviherbaspirillum cavernae]